MYKDYIKLLVNRYKCSPAIFAWELANEVRLHAHIVLSAPAYCNPSTA